MEKSSQQPEIQPVSAAMSGGNVDKAYEFAKQHQIGSLSDADNKRILSKIDRHLLPLVRTGGRAEMRWHKSRLTVDARALRR